MAGGDHAIAVGFYGTLIHRVRLFPYPEDTDLQDDSSFSAFPRWPLTVVAGGDHAIAVGFYGTLIHRV
ncbi:hypothetical protein CP990_28685, partial [Escherichia coli]